MIENVIPLGPPRQSDDEFIAAMREEFVALLKEEGLKFTEVARHMGLSVAAVTQWKNEKYTGSDIAVAHKAADWMRKFRAKQKIAPKMKTVKTRDYKDAVGALQLADVTNGIAVVTGAPGCGKTHAAKDFAAARSTARVLMASHSWSSPTGCARGIIFELTGAKTTRRVDDIEKDLILQLRKKPLHLLINDAHCLDFRAVDWLCSIAEQCDIPISLLGHEMLLDHLRTIQWRDSELWDRIRSRSRFQTLGGKLTRADVEAVARQIFERYESSAIDVLVDKALALSMRDIIMACTTARALQERSDKKLKLDAALIREAIRFIMPPDPEVKHG